MRMREGVLNGQKLFDETKKKGYSGAITMEQKVFTVLANYLRAPEGVLNSHI